MPLLSSLATLPLLIASKCDQKETQELKDKKLTKKYEKEYIDKQRYVFDDFEQFKMKDEYFEKKENSYTNNAWSDYANRGIKTYSLTNRFFKKLEEIFKFKLGILNNFNICSNSLLLSSIL